MAGTATECLKQLLTWLPGTCPSNWAAVDPKLVSALPHITVHTVFLSACLQLCFQSVHILLTLCVKPLQVVCVSLHPGTVNTDLSRPYHKNVPKDRLFDTERSVSYLMSIIDALSIDKTGKAYSWDGTELPW